MQWERIDHWLKLPATQTFRACGAVKAKQTRSPASRGRAACFAGAHPARSRSQIPSVDAKSHGNLLFMRRCVPSGAWSGETLEMVV